MKKNRNFKKALVVLSCTLMLGACNGKSSDGEIIATSKAGDITTHDYFNSVNQEMLSNTMLDVAINKVLSKKYEDKIDKKSIDKTFEEEIKNYGGEKKFKELLKKQSPNMSIEDYKQRRYLDAYKEKFIAENIKVSDDDIKKEVRNVSQIIYPLNNGKKIDIKTAQEQMEKIQSEVSKSSKKFDTYQDKDSKQPKYFVNNLGFVTKNDVLPNAQNIVFKLKKGEVSKVIKEESALYIFKVNDKTPKDNELKELKLKLIRDKISKDPKVLQDAYKDLLKEYDVKFSDESISKTVESQLNSKKDNKNE
ncbi:peptidylprolyl isomerase [Macrococcus capreoli]|uniref:peptidylprolyl isomerase n=1 Tax=Macrococcus capreoli TaxID=2982690 RepID=UPI003EE595AF